MAVLDVDQQHLAGLQPPLLHDLRLRDVEHAHLRGHDDEVVVGDEVAGGPQAVAVQRRADELAVGEGHGRRAVPGLHEGRVVLVEGAALGVHERVARPGLGDHEHHRVGDRVAAHHEELERVVERGRVGLAFVDEGPDLVEVGPEELGVDGRLARADPVEVALQRVDLAVVRDEAERVREVPRRERVGREALVGEGERRDEALVVQVGEELADLVGEQHALVDDGPVRERGHVELPGVREPQRADGVAGGLADDVELPLEGVAVELAAARAHEHLPDHRHRALRGVAERGGVDRHFAPAEERLALVDDGPLDLAHAGRARRRVLRQEHHAHAVGAGLGELHLQLGHLLAEEAVGDLHEDARAVAVQRVRARGAPVREVVEDREPVRHDVVGLLPLDVRDEAHAARVVLVAGVIEALGARQPSRDLHCGFLSAIHPVLRAMLRSGGPSMRGGFWARFRGLGRAFGPGGGAGAGHRAGPQGSGESCGTLHDSGRDTALQQSPRAPAWGLASQRRALCVESRKIRAGPFPGPPDQDSSPVTAMFSSPLSWIARAAAACAAALTLASCGGGVSANPSPVVDSPTLTILPATATMYSGLPTTFVLFGRHGRLHRHLRQPGDPADQRRGDRPLRDPRPQPGRGRHRPSP